MFKFLQRRSPLLFSKAVSVFGVAAFSLFFGETAFAQTQTELLPENAKQLQEELFSNVFTPNGDGKNDTFGPNAVENFQNYRFIILDRWGKAVFDSEKNRLPWDGQDKFAAKPAPDGVYVYSFEAQNREGQKVFLHGTVFLIR